MASENAKRDNNHVPVMLAYNGSEVKMLRVNASGQLVVSSSVSAGVPEHHNGTVSTVDATITLSGTSTNLNIHNTHASNNLLVSFDSGTTFYTLEAGSYWNVDFAVSSFVIKGSASGTTYEIVAAVAS